MADGRLRVIGVPPAGPGLKKALARYAKEGAVLTAFDDAKLHALALLLPESAEVDKVPFGQVLGRFLTMLGEPTGRIATKGQIQAAVGLVCKDLPGDSPLASSSRFPGMASIVMERLAELRDWNFEPLELLSAAEDASPALSAKLRSLAEVDEKLREIMAEGNRKFATDLVNACLDVPPLDDIPVRRVIVAVGGDERPAYERWLRWLIGFGTEVIVLLDTVPESPALFSSSARTASRLATQIEPAKGSGPWYSALFSDATTRDAPEIEVVTAADPLSEAEWAVRGCLQDIQAGTYPHKIGVFARDSETYAPLLTASAQRLGLPFTASLIVPLLTNGFAVLTLRSLEALAGDDVRALTRLAGSSYLPVGLEGRRLLREAAKSAYVQGDGQWQAISTWAQEQGEEFDWLRHMLAWRDEAVSAGATLAGWLIRLRDLIGGTSIVDLSASAEPRTRERDNRAQTVLQQSLTNYASVYDRTELPELGLRSFVDLATELWEEETMIVDATKNGVRLLSNTASLTSFDVLYVVGMLEGTLPRRRAEDPILFDGEREELSALAGRGVRLTNSHDRAIAERDEFVRICSAAEKRIVFSYPQTDADSDNVPAFYLDEIDRAVEGGVRRTVRPRSHVVPLAEACRAANDILVRAALDGPRQPTEPPKLATVDARAQARPEFEKGVSPEEFGLALVCPFQAAMRYRLRLLAPARRRLMRSLRELPALSLIAAQGDRESARAMLESHIDEYIQDIYADFEPWELAMLSAAAHRLAQEWVDREFRSRDLWQEEGEQSVPNVSLGENDLRNEFTIRGRKVRLEGRATALTTRKDYTLLRFYDGTTPKLEEGKANQDDAFLYGLYLMSQYHLRQRSPMVEVDGMDGERILAGFTPTIDSVKRDPANGIRTVRVADRPTTFFQDVKDRLRTAVEVLDDAHIPAKPGPHCEHCSYGEMCRVSSVFGEAGDAMEEDGP